METIEAIYDDGKVILKKKPGFKKARILITFIESIEEDNSKIKFPTTDLGRIKNIKRADLYNDYLSD